MKGGSRPQGGPAPFSQALDEAQDHGRARETIRLFGQQELDEISLITADGRVFAGDEPLPPFQEPGTALLRARSNGHNELDEDGRAQDCVTEGVTSELLAEIAADPAGYYVNVHNATFPAGAVRGQLEQNPRAVIPSPGDRFVYASGCSTSTAATLTGRDPGASSSAPWSRSARW